jgi:hypothetical protein
MKSWLLMIMQCFITASNLNLEVLHSATDPVMVNMHTYHNTQFQIQVFITCEYAIHSFTYMQ